MWTIDWLVAMGWWSRRRAIANRQPRAVGLLVWVMAVWPVVLAGAPMRASEPPDATSQMSELDRRIAQWIEQLGDPDFARREKAQAELERIGLDAFDALREAAKHDDIEVALRAKYLLRRLQFRWYSEQDPIEVRRVLRDYPQLTETDRRSRIDRLAQLPDGQGLPALCRLVRFETDIRLAKYGALQILRYGDPGEGPERQRRAAMIQETLLLSRNPAARWLRTFALWLVEPSQADAGWNELLDAEARALADFPEDSSVEIVRGLFQWRAEQLLAAGRREQAAAIVDRMLVYVSDRREDVRESVDWLIKQELYEQVHTLAKRFPQIFDENLLLQYRLAEVYHRQGLAEEAEQAAQKALAKQPQQFDEHLEAAFLLQERGLFDWAEREFNSVIQAAGDGNLAALRARFFLAEMYHDQLRNLEAAQTLEPMAEAAKSNPEYANRVRNARGGADLSEIVARLHFFYAEHFASTDRAKQKEHLRLAVEAFPQEIDVLIAMYRFPDADEEWMKLTRERIRDTVGYYREQIRLITDRMQQNVEPSLEDTFRSYLARLHNQLAWLVANTEGDYDEALRSSKLSLELRPGTAAYLDTLARCYYAKHDYANAVKYQRQALALEPYSGQMRRQLALFEKALAQPDTPPNR